MTNLDELDRKILRMLVEDSRLSYREIAKRLGVSHANVSSRIRLLEDKKVIRGYATIVDPELMNLFSLCIRISSKTGADLSKIGKEIADLEQVSEVVRVSGDCDLLVLATCRDKPEAISLLSKISKVEGIDRVESHVVLEIIKRAGKKLGD